MQTDTNLILAYQRIAELEARVEYLTTMARRLIDEADETTALIVADEARRKMTLTEVQVWTN